MVWTIEFEKKAKKEFSNLDHVTKKQINKFLLKLIKSANPRQFGEALKGNMHSFWRYRIGDYRIICNIEDAILTIIILRVKHRKEVYRKLM